MLDDVFTLEKVGTDADGNTIKERRNADGATVAGITAEVKLGIKGIFEIQAGYTFQRSRYTSPERWSDDVEPQRRMFRSPDHYGYLTSSFELARRLSASLFCTYTGPMLVQHNAGILDVDTQTTTPSFWDCGIKAAYVVPLSHVIDLEINAGVKNIFDSYQKDLDFGASKDSAYIYGPSMPRTFFVGLKLTL